LAAAILPRRTLRIGLTGLARSGKTALLTSIAGNLRALAAGYPVLPALRTRLDGRRIDVSPAPAGAEALPRFDTDAHLAALAADPPVWPARTSSVSLLALDLEIARTGLGLPLPPRRLRLEILDYPGEWLMDLPLLGQDFPRWSASVLRRLEAPDPPAAVRAFLSFVHALPASATAGETVAAEGYRLYRAALHALRQEGRTLLQPGRFVMPAPGPEPPWMAFFPMTGSGGLARLLASRYAAYVRQVRQDLLSPGFSRIDRLIVLADVLSALHAGPVAFADVQAALQEAASALSWRRGLPEWLAALGRLELPPPPIRRVAFVASKADHVAERQRGNLASLMRALTSVPQSARASTAAFAVAAINCTEDIVVTLEGHPVSAVRGRVAGDGRMARSYPGEVPSTPPDAAFWAHPFLSLPAFDPKRLPDDARGGVPQIGVDALLAFLLDDVL
jgi:predicted YcjX-like family ATPase